ncbi:hypothetical protein EJB05_12506, partial [Eragrostis curvula]
MLDRYPFSKHDLCFSKEDEAASSLCRTSQGDPFRVSFRFAAPPAVSRFYLHVKEGSVLSHDIENSCQVIAAHRNALLFCLLVPLPVPVEYLSNPETEPFPVFYKRDRFVYTAGGDRASLKLLPPCLEVDNGDSELEALSPGERLYNPLAGIIQFSCEALGVLCNDDGDYVVAYLVVGPGIPAVPGAEIIAQLCLYFSSHSHWECHGLPICCVDSKDIDYHRGILFCEVFGEHLQVKYLRLPVEARRFPNVCMDLYRSVSIVKDDEGRSKMKFVDVRPSRGYGKYPVSDDSKLWCGVKKVSLVSIDLNSGSVKDVFPYINGSDDLFGGDADMALH